MTLPHLLVLDDELSGEPAGTDAGEEDRAEPTGIQAPDEAHGMQRLRDEMLGDSERGLSIEEVANLSGLAVNTVRAYLSDQRRKVLGQRIRANDQARARALQIVFERRLSDEDGV